MRPLKLGKQSANSVFPARLGALARDMITAVSLSPLRPLDDLDLAILAELESNARITFSELARRLGSPNSTIRDRIRALEENKVIRGYTAIIDPKKLGLGIKAIIQVTRAQDFFWRKSSLNP